MSLPTDKIAKDAKAALDALDRAQGGARDYGRKHANRELLAATQEFEAALKTETVAERVAARRHTAAVHADARLDKFLAKWSEAEATKLWHVLNSFGSLNLRDMHQQVAYMKSQLDFIAEDDSTDPKHYLKISRAQHMDYWKNHRAKRADDMWANFKKVKQFVVDWERTMK